MQCVRLHNLVETCLSQQWHCLYIYIFLNGLSKDSRVAPFDSNEMLQSLGSGIIVDLFRIRQTMLPWVGTDRSDVLCQQYECLSDCRVIGSLETP